MGLADQWNNHVDHIVETADRLGNSMLLRRFFACLYAYCNLEERCLAMQEWKDFNEGVWQKEINVRDFIQKNYLPYDGDDRFLAGPTVRTKGLWQECTELLAKEIAKILKNIE